MIFIGLIALIFLLTTGTVSAAVYTGQLDRLTSQANNAIEKARAGLVRHYAAEIEQQRRIDDDQARLQKDIEAEEKAMLEAEPHVTVTYKNNGTTQQQNVRVIYRNTSSNSVDLNEIQRQNEEYVRNMSEQSRLNLEEFRKQSEASMKEFELSGQQGLEEFRKTNEANQQQSIEEFKQKYGIE